MFDDINNKNNQNPQSQPKLQTSQTPPVPPTPQAQQQASQTPQVKKTEPEDMFAGLDKQAPQAPGQNVPEQKSPQAPISNLSQIPPKSNKKIMILGGIALGFLIIMLIAYFAVTKLLSTTTYEDIDIENGQMISGEVESAAEEPAENEIVETETQAAEPSNQLSQDEMDNDNDGLTNAEERALGTNLNAMDSDGDGLFDNEEVNTYKTDPLNVDSDGDGILDGTEVRSGNDPNGPGKLFNVPGTQSTTTIQVQDTMDTDNDGLTDREENELGTNISKIDSDSDKLDDYAEVNTYKTDPLNPDTDGDGYLDGTEVENGYNPNGPGKLN